jgi:DNA-binding beta-propeller fold protein YncE
MRKHSLIPVWLCAVVCLLLLSSGCVISPRRTFGQIGPTPTPTPTATPTPINSPTPTPTPAGPATGKLYVSNSVGNSILRFDDAFTDSGNIVPAATITGALTTLNAPAFIALDAVADRLYVANSSDASVLVFDNISTKNGNVAPDRTISGLVTPTDVSVDTTKDLLYVADDSDILVFDSASTATGTVTPAQDLSVTFTISAIFIDAANDRLYVADAADNAIDVFDNASTLTTSNVTATRTIQGTATHLAAPGGIQIDGSGRLVVSNNAAGAASITIYSSAAAASGGNIVPLGEIKGSNTGLNSPDQIAVDTSGLGTVYNVDSGAARVAAFTNLGTATGNIAPTRSIVGSATGLTTSARPVGVALDNTR